MLKRIPRTKSLIAIGLTSLLSVSLSGLPELVWAKTTPKTAQQSANDKSHAGFPTRRVGGGTRCAGLDRPCPSDFLTALMPENLVKTATATPTFWFYLPQIERSQTIEVEFVLRDESDRLIQETTLVTTGQAGIMSFPLPTTAAFQGLKLDRTYHWYLSIVYDPLHREYDDVVEGWIQRVPWTPALEQQLAQATPLKKVELYREAGLWYEALSLLAQLKRDRPDDASVSALWTELLQSVHLETLAQKPLSRSSLRISQQR